MISRCSGRSEAQIGRELTLNEVIGVEMATISTPIAEVVDWLLETVTVRPGFAELVAAHDPLIVSAGFRELIEPVLAREGVGAEVVANRLVPGPDGWRAAFLEREPVRCVASRASASRSPALARSYVGDGISDRCVSLAADRVFARDGLARWLDEQGAPTRPSTTCTTSGGRSFAPRTTPQGDARGRRGGRSTRFGECVGRRN